MNDRKIKLILGCLLHDIGKLLYRYNDGRNHSQSGYEFMKEELGIEDIEILDQIRYHHSAHLSGARIDDDSLAYISYWADNVAAGADRREKDDGELGYDKNMPLSSVFNILNENNQKHTYKNTLLDKDKPINFPNFEGKGFNSSVYSEIVDNIRDSIKNLTLTKEYVNSLVEILEGNTSFVPSSTDKKQLADISLYDHQKIAAAVGTCIYDYLVENEVSDFKDKLKVKGTETYKEEAFLLASMDVSGIQSFIYTSNSEKMLKNLRARSFYIEMMVEHIIDELLEELELSRANLIYSGGGHAYILLPNTETAKSKLEKFEKNLNQWFIDNFATALYVAFGYSACSANNLSDKPEGSYKEIFAEIGKKISEKKLHKYSRKEIISLNEQVAPQNERECKVCNRVDLLIEEEDKCGICSALEKMSENILKKDFIIVLEHNEESKGLVLPFDRYMIMDNEEALLEKMKKEKGYIRSYGKNKMYTGFNISTKLWVGDYCNGNTFEELAKAAQGIKRLGVLRADIDSLGQAFVMGFKSEYVSLSRTATLSRQLSLFFKLHINSILEKGGYSLKGEKVTKRKAIIIYSGGDDLFVIGAWNEILEFAIDLNKSFKKYTQETLTISGGIGIFPEKYPVSAMARQSGELEELSKEMEGKDSITIFEKGHSYKWKEFEKEVIGEKFDLINRYFSLANKGNSLIYKFVEFIRNREDRLNIARYAYLLGRIEPEAKASTEEKELFKEFAEKMYHWINDDKQSEQLITALYIYVYTTRAEKE